MNSAVAIIGNPNTGKTTIFNALTGLRQHVGNYPGVTVERKTGEVATSAGEVDLIDLPGTYSLSAQSPDEMVVLNVLKGHQKGEHPLSGVIVIVDASNVKRNLYLVSQVMELNLPMVVVLNMMDVASMRGVVIDVPALQKRLGVPVVAVQGNIGNGIDELRRLLADITTQKIPAARTPELPQLQLPPECTPMAMESIRRYHWIRAQLHGVVRQSPMQHSLFSDRLDHVLTHRLWGTTLFVVIMVLVFQAIYSWAAPLQEAIDAGATMLGAWVGGFLPEGMLQSLVVDGIFRGVGSVLSFLPQILFLFLFIAILEDCGYMARAAFLMDRLFARIGLSGKSFIPMLSSFACAIPGVMSTRTIENPRDRLITMLVAPLMSCSARLPVYTLMIAAFVPSITWMGGLVGLQGLTLFLMHCVGFFVAIPVVYLLKRTVLKGATPPFVMELPIYKRPSAKLVLWRSFDRGKAFVQSAGTIILAMAVIIWALSYFPTPKDNYFSRIGHVIEPAVKPLGWDWRIGMAVVSAFPAREVVIAALGTTYNVGSDVDEESDSLRQALHEAQWPDGRPVYSMAVALSIMVFFALCCQCGATVATIRREANSWKWAGFAFVYMTALAYVAAFGVYQLALAFGWGAAL
jgi:ferrous iron transport protein B